MSLKVGELFGTLTLDDGPFNRSMAGIGGALGGLTKIAGMAMLGVGAVLAAGAVKGVMAFADFQQEIGRAHV